MKFSTVQVRFCTSGRQMKIDKLKIRHNIWYIIKGDQFRLNYILRVNTLDSTTFIRLNKWSGVFYNVHPRILIQSIMSTWMYSNVSSEEVLKSKKELIEPKWLSLIWILGKPHFSNIPILNSWKLRYSRVTFYGYLLYFISFRNSKSLRI